MVTTAIINNKGGVGKTSVAANLAAQLAAKGYKVLVLDIDPQADLTNSLISPDEWREKYTEKKTIANWFDAVNENKNQSLESLILTPENVNDDTKKKSISGRLDIIPSQLYLEEVYTNLVRMLGGASMQQSAKNYITVHRNLCEGIGELQMSLLDIDDTKRSYDSVLIDCPPNFSIVTKNALIACDNFIIPVKLDAQSADGIARLVNGMSNLVIEHNDLVSKSRKKHTKKISPDMLGIVFTMVQKREGKAINSLKNIENQIRNMEYSLFDNQLRENKTIYADAPRSCIPVVLKKTYDNSHRQVIEELVNFSEEYIKRSGI